MRERVRAVGPGYLSLAVSEDSACSRGALEEVVVAVVVVSAVGAGSGAASAGFSPSTVSCSPA